MLRLAQHVRGICPRYERKRQNLGNPQLLVMQAVPAFHANFCRQADFPFCMCRHLLMHI
jgi:hypothetical protein